MGRKIQRHATRASQHDAALDAAFAVGQRVRTIDGFTGRIIFVTESFSPGNTAYQVELDNGMGGGTYLASQLRAVPDSYRSPSSPASNLPAGVTAALEAEAAEIHTADLDYPEMGTILQDRPDPAGQITVIGSRTAATYAEGYDPRDTGYNGESDVGVYWQAPAEQAWVDDNLGEPPPPEVEDVGLPPAEATSLSGRPGTGEVAIDGHGDAPHHGADPDHPRAADPVAYDNASTEGTGDPRWSEPMPDTDKRAANGAQVGQMPEGMSAGDGPGLSIGGFTAHTHTARVPWTGQERTHLHSWDNHAAASAGDFVPSTNFTNKIPVNQEQLSEPAEEVIERELQATAALDIREHLTGYHYLPAQAQDPEFDESTAHGLHDAMHYRDAQEGVQTHLHPEHYSGWPEDRSPEQALDTAGTPDDIGSYGWQVMPEDVSTEEQHGNPGARRPLVMHTLSSLSDDPAWLHGHVQAEHGWDRATADELYASGGIKPLHDADHASGEGHHHPTRDVGLCAYVHHGPCQWPGDTMARTSESLRHSRPRGLTTSIEAIAPDDPRQLQNVYRRGEVATHVLEAYHGGRHVGSLHFQQSDDGRAIHVNMLHTLRARATGQGIGSAMMDDLYSHAARSGAWLDHGTRTEPGTRWWTSYREPHPELSTHNAPPDRPMPATPNHPGGASWSHYFSPHEIAGDMWENSKYDESGESRTPGWDAGSYPDDMHHEKWRQARPRPQDDHLPSDDELDAFGREHGLSFASLQAQASAYADEEWERHLKDAHGYGDDDITHMYYQHGRLDDPHQAIHDAGLADHDHPSGRDPDQRREDVMSQFGRPIHQELHLMQSAPGRGGRMPADPYHAVEWSDPAHVRDPLEWTHEQELRRLSALTEARSKRIADEVHALLAKDYPADATAWVHGKGVRWSGAADIPLSEIDFDGHKTWNAYQQPERVEKAGKKREKRAKDGKDPKPGIGFRGPGESRVRAGDGHHRLLDQALNGDTWHAYTAEVPERQGPWTEMHSKQFRGGDTGKIPGPDGTEEDRAEFRHKVDDRVREISEGADSLDVGDRHSTGSGAARPSRKGKPRQPVVPRQRHDQPGNWPLATALVQDGDPALTQGTHDGKHRKMRAPADPNEAPPKPGKKEKKAALAAFTAAASSPSFRFEFTASWKDVLAKAARLRKAGRVRIVHASAGMVIAEVGGDHDVYESGIQRPPGRPQTIQHWACGCPWASFRQDKSLPGRLNGRPCSHVMAVQLESTARGASRGQDVLRDPHLPELGLPRHDVVVKSMPPWGPGGWHQTWLAPAASLHKTAEMTCPRCGDDRDGLGQCYGCGLVSQDPRDSGGPDPDTEEGQLWLRQHHYANWSWPPYDDHQISSQHEHEHGWEMPHWDDEFPMPNRGGETQNEHQRRYRELKDLDAETEDWKPDVDDPYYQSLQNPAHYSALILLAAGEKRADIEALATAAGVHLSALSPSQRLTIRHLQVAHGVGSDALTRAAGNIPRYHQRLHEARAGVKIPHSHERDQDTGQLTGPAAIVHQGAANDPWGDNNYASHPPQQPYGATEPPNKDMSPASYGPLAGPDPDDWGEIENTGLQQPLSNEAARHGPVLASPQDRVVAPTFVSSPHRDLDYPAVAAWQDERGATFPYVDQSNTAGPSTSAEPRDPGGIRMEESLDSDRDDYVRHLIDVHGFEPGPHLGVDYEGHAADHVIMNRFRDRGEPIWNDHPYEEMAHERRWGRDRWPDAGSSHSFTGSADREMPDPTPWAGEHHHPECECPTCDYNRYHARHQAPALIEPMAPGVAESAARDEKFSFPKELEHMLASAMAAAVSELKDHPEPALPETTADPSEPDLPSSGYALDPQATGGGPGMSPHDESLSPTDTSIQTMGTQQAGAGEDSMGDLAFSVSPQEGGAEAYADDPVSQFQATAAAAQYLEKTADVLPQAEADELIREGRGQRARNLGLLQLEGTHYEDEEAEMERRGLSLDHFDDDLALM